MSPQSWPRADVAARAHHMKMHPEIGSKKAHNNLQQAISGGRYV
jgi:hypothetical protein